MPTSSLSCAPRSPFRSRVTAGRRADAISRRKRCFHQRSSAHSDGALTPSFRSPLRMLLKYQQAESSATTDYLTGLPNARSLFLHLDAELRAGAAKLNLVGVCDLEDLSR